MLATRHTARCIVVRGGQILLMERWRDGLHYFSIPGGGVETGESFEQAAMRELAEETTVVAIIERLIIIMYDGERQHHIYLCQYRSGEPRLASNAPEQADAAVGSHYVPQWIALPQLATLPLLYWEPLREVLVDGLANGFGDTPLVVKLPV